MFCLYNLADVPSFRYSLRSSGFRRRKIRKDDPQLSALRLCRLAGRTINRQALATQRRALRFWARRRDRRLCITSTAAVQCSRLRRVGHTLDLQRGLPYDSVHDLTAKPLDEWRAVLSGYDAVLTALDNEVAILAVDAGLRVAIYDPLAWYFAEIPAVAKRTLYLAQDFFGVAERYLERHASCHQL